MPEQKKILRTVTLGFLSWVVYRLRRRLISRGMKLRQSLCDVRMELGLMVAMDDGVRLATDHYFPLMPEEKGPTILIRTPYGRRFGLGVPGLLSTFIAQRLAERGYHVIVQDVRGRYDSEGYFEPFLNEGEDGRQTLEWIRRQPWSNGQVGTWGPSYLGFVQWAMATAAPHGPDAMMPMIIGSRTVHGIHANNTFGFDTALHWISLLHIIGHKERPPLAQTVNRILDALQERKIERAERHLPLQEADEILVGHPISYYRAWLKNTSPHDAYWRGFDPHARLDQMQVPIFLFTGWYDVMLQQMLIDYNALRAAGQRPHLTIGPWVHSDPAYVPVSLRQGLAWFDAHLKNDNSKLREKPVAIFVQGAGEWREYEDWPPPARQQPFYLHENQWLSREGPGANEAPDHYLYNPADPTPAIAGPLYNPRAGRGDNRELEARADVLTYTTAVLAKPAEIIGPVRMQLFARSSLEYVDFFGRLCDVTPDGRSLNICDGLLRVDPQTAQRQADGSLLVEIDMWATAYRIFAGHRLRLQLSSGAHPRFPRNLGSGEPLASGRTMRVSRQTILHDQEHPSAVILPLAA